jgi:hypothetical protein
MASEQETRDMFAAHALAAMVAARLPSMPHGLDEVSVHGFVATAYGIADTMMAERARRYPRPEPRPHEAPPMEWDVMTGSLRRGEMSGCTDLLTEQALEARPAGWTEKEWLVGLGKAMSVGGPWHAWAWASRQEKRVS